MGKIEQYRDQLRRLRSWNEVLLAGSNLPGPRGNLELVAAVADVGDTYRFLRLLEFTPDRAPTGTAEEFLAVCGAVGLGKSIAEGETSLWPRLRELASDPRWRVREGVAMALQRIGDNDILELLDRLGPWIEGNLLERRAVAAGLCEPRLLRTRKTANEVLKFISRITASVKSESDRKSESFRVLRQALGYCWSVAVVASPVSGRRMFEKLAESADPDVKWIVRENLKKQRLKKLDASWAERLARKTTA